MVMASCRSLSSSGCATQSKAAVAAGQTAPLKLGGILLGGAAIGRELELRPSDRSLNVMPLTHIGGISSSLLAALLSGGAVRCTPGFDPALIAGWLTASPAPTWYYAVPTIHSAVLMACPTPGAHKLRLIRSG